MNFTEFVIVNSSLNGTKYFVEENHKKGIYIIS